jgi:hypothetical protein
LWRQARREIQVLLASTALPPEMPRGRVPSIDAGDRARGARLQGRRRQRICPIETGRRMRLVLRNGGYCSDPRPRGSAIWANERDRSVTAARAQRKCRRRAQSSSVATQHQPRDRLDPRVCWIDTPLAVAVCSPAGGRESASDSAMCGGTGNRTARTTGLRQVSAIRDRPARVPAGPDLPDRSSAILPRAATGTRLDMPLGHSWYLWDGADSGKAGVTWRD